MQTRGDGLFIYFGLSLARQSEWFMTQVMSAKSIWGAEELCWSIRSLCVWLSLGQKYLVVRSRALHRLIVTTDTVSDEATAVASILNGSQSWQRYKSDPDHSLSGWSVYRSSGKEGKEKCWKGAVAMFAYGSDQPVLLLVSAMEHTARDVTLGRIVLTC